MRQSESVFYQEIPQPKLQAKQFTNWSKGDIIVLCVTLAIVIVTWILGSLVLALFIGVFLLPLSIRLPSGYGRLYYELYQEINGAIIDGPMGGILWLADDTSPRLIKWLRRRRPAIKLKLVSIRAEIDGQVERYSLMQSLDRPYDHLLLAADGGAFSSLDINRMATAVNELAAHINSTLTKTEMKIGASFVRMNGPFDPTVVASYLRNSMDPTVAEPSWFDLDEDSAAVADWLRTNASQLRVTAAQSGASTSWYLIVITIKRSRKWRSAQKGLLSDQELFAQPIVELGRTLVEDLSNSNLLELKNVRCLGLSELSSVARCGWDVTSIVQYYQDKASGDIPSNDTQIDELRSKHGDQYINQLLQSWPKERIEISKADHFVRMDGNYISILRVTQLPDVVRADQFMSLHYTLGRHSWTRSAMVGQAVSGDAETTQLVIGNSALKNFEGAFFKDRVVRNPKFAKKQRQLAEQTQQISAHSKVQHFNMLEVVVASSLQKLIKERDQRISLLKSKQFKAEIVKGSGRMMNAMITGTYGINRL